MSNDRENDASLISKLLTYLGIVITFQLLGFVSIFAYSSYLNRAGSFAQSFVFQSPDEPLVSVGFLRPRAFGNHFFGDYLQIYADVKTSGNGGYFGASQLFLLLATKLPYYLSLMFLFAIAILLLCVSARLLLNGLGLPRQLALLVGAVLFTQPVLLAIDRGQIHILLFTLLLLGLTLSIKDGGNKTWGAILIAAAVSMKLTPVFFLFLFVRKHAWRELKVSLVSLIGLVLIPFAYLDSGFGAWKFVQGFIVGSKAESNTYSSIEYFTGNLAYNNSFNLLSYHFSQMNSGFGNVGGFVYDHYLLCAGLLSVFLCWLIIQKSISQFESVLLMTIASSLLIPIAGRYTLMVFILPIVVVLADKDFAFSRLNIIYCCYLGMILMPKQIDLRLQTFEPYAITLGGILDPSLSFLVVLFISGKCFFSADSQDSDSKTHVPVF